MNTQRKESRAAKARPSGDPLIAKMHGALTVYNGVVVLLVAAFMSLTQVKVVQSMTARSFVGTLPVMPAPAAEMFASAAGGFLLLVLLGRCYREDRLPETVRYACLVAEIAACVFLMRSLNLAYDGVVLLVVADLMHRYGGRYQRVLLALAMAGLYSLASYNLAAFQGSVVPFSAYTAYYAPDARAVLDALRNTFISGGSILFVLYLVLLVQDKHQEKERLQSLSDQLAEANVRLRAYALEAERTAETRERNRLAREIHDTLGHALTGIVAGLDACIVMVGTAPDFTKNQLEKIRETALRGIKDVRRSVKKLRPDDLEQLSLREALLRMCEEFSASSGMEVRLNVLGWPENLRADEEEVLYRAVQEGVTNAKRHGRAKHVTVTLGKEPGRIYLLLADDGIGCGGQEVKVGFGLRHMQERVALLHGRVRWWSGKGFTLEVTIPQQEVAG